MSAWPVLGGFVALATAVQAAILTGSLDLATWAVCVAFAAFYALAGMAFMWERQGLADPLKEVPV